MTTTPNTGAPSPDLDLLPTLTDLIEQVRHLEALVALIPTQIVALAPTEERFSDAGMRGSMSEKVTSVREAWASLAMKLRSYGVMLTQFTTTIYRSKGDTSLIMQEATESMEAIDTLTDALLRQSFQQLTGGPVSLDERVCSTRPRAENRLTECLMQVRGYTRDLVTSMHDLIEGAQKLNPPIAPQD